MNWSKDRSLGLSKVCIWLFAAAVVAGCIAAPWLVKKLISPYAENLSDKIPLFLTSIYLAALPAAAALWDLWHLLGNIGSDSVFILKNVAILRRLSWYCIAAGLVCLVSGLYYLPFLMISAAAAFMGLILRVVKNVISQAIQIKDENDYTI